MGARMPFWVALGAVLLAVLPLVGCGKTTEPVSTCVPNTVAGCPEVSK